MLQNPLPELDMTECRAQLIWANERDIEPRHLHLDSSFEGVTVCWLIERGSVVLIGPEGEVKAGAGEWIFPGSYCAEQLFSPRARISSIRFTLTYPGGDPLFVRKKSRIWKSGKSPALEKASAELIRVLNPWSERKERKYMAVGRNRIPFDENLRIEAAFYHWLAAYACCQHQMGEEMQSRSPGDTRVRQALVRLESLPFQEGFSEGDLARECGLSVNQLNRLFKRETGVSPFQYFDRMRLQRARQALSETGLQVKEVAYELGFSSSPHFTNWFKQREGTGPRAYRNKELGRV